MAIIDTRELILEQIFTIMAAIPGAPVDPVYRDRGSIPPEKRPCALLLDGVEVTVGEVERRSGRGESLPRPLVVELQPDIFFLLRRRGLDESLVLAGEISSYRMAVLAAFWFDAPLKALLGMNGGIVYRGFETDMQNASLAQGEMKFNLGFRYILDPAHLVA